MSFNYRLIKNDRDNSIGIHEVYYNDKGKAISYTKNPVAVGNDLDDLKRELANINSAFNDPILEVDIFGDFKE